MTQNKKGAMEMSVGTIVTIVLLMSVLVLGLFLIQNIFGSAQSAVDLTDQQLKSEIEKLFSSEDKIVIYPTSRFVEIDQEEIGGIGIGIRNLNKGVAGEQSFSYEVVVQDAGDCGTVPQVAQWFKIGRSGNNIPIAVGDTYTTKVLIQVPTGAPLCTARFGVNVKDDGGSYSTDFFDLQVNPK